MHAAPSGTLALVGSGEYLPVSEPLDRALLERLSTPARVVVLPTAAAPDGPGVPERWARMGVEHFTRLGVSVEAVLLLTRKDAESATLAAQIASANFIYLSGGKPLYLLETLRETACWRAIASVHAAGGVVAGCSAGAMALAGELLDWPRLWRTRPALGLAPGLAVIPHFDELPPWLAAGASRLAARSIPIAGIEGATALVGTDGTWTVLGRGAVTILYRGRALRYVAGERVLLPSPAAATIPSVSED
jgi:cyanophycinase